MILLNTGSLTENAGRAEDFELLQDWLTATDCGLDGVRRGLILNGDGIATLMSDEGSDWLAVGFSKTILGVTLLARAYREYNGDPNGCVRLAPAPGAEFAPEAPMAVFGNGCPEMFEYAVLEPTPGRGASGNLLYEPGSGASGFTYPEVGFAQVVKESLAGPGEVGGWKSIVDGFSYHHLSEVDFGGAECSAESAAVVAGIVDFLVPELAWLTDGGAVPFDLWSYPCADSSADSLDDVGPCGPVDYLCRVRPNPAHETAIVRFIASGNHPVRVSVFDANGRLVRTLYDGPAGMGMVPLIWNGRDDGGHTLPSGVYWVQMRAGDYRSSKELILMR
jgi:hypothetical protein